MKFYIKAAALLMLTVSLTLSACGGGGDTGGGDTETPASTLFANKSYLAPGAICPAGGIQIDMGFDNNKNNVLDADEITKTEYVCNGEDASSHPFVVYTSPTPNETDVELDTVISAVFNTEMDETTITDQTFTVKDSSGNSVAGTVSYSGIVAVFTPTEPLVINMKYTVNLLSTIENENDIAMGYDHKIYFTGGKAAVLYKANGATGGTVPVDTTRYNTGVSVNASANSGNLVKTGFSFSGWNTKATGDGETYAVNAPISITTTSVVLYAMWTTAYTVTYDGNDATSGTAPSDSNLYTFGLDVTVKANTGTLVKTGLHFAGWNTNSSGTGTTYAPDAVFQMGNANVTLYARWMTDPFLSATNPGDAVTVTSGTTAFDMIYANNAASITFPTGINDAATATITTKFFMGKTEVTYQLWKEVYDWATDPARGANRYYFANQGREGNDGIIGAVATNQEPVTTINWRDAMIWCNALTEYYNDKNGTSIVCVYTYSNVLIRDSRDSNAVACDGAVAGTTAKGFRLPTSNEWEYAARYRTDSTNTVSGYSNPCFTKGNSASGAITYWNDATGSSPNFAGKLANDAVAVYKYFSNGSTWIDNGTNSTSIVKSKASNALGLYDMSGNVFEWCFDLIGFERVIRGGSWSYLASGLPVGYFGTNLPGDEIGDMGFRIVKNQ